MKTFRLIPEVIFYDEIDEFIANHNFDNEFVLISKSVFQKYFKDIPKDNVHFHSDYGNSEPTDDMVNNLIKDFKSSNCSRILAVGGGSIIDMAKFLTVADFDNVQEIFDNKNNLEKKYPLIAIPTTCGAGSEVSNISIVEMSNLNSKLGLACDQIFPDKAILIPKLIEGLPYHAFITSSIDGLIHAIESFLSPKSNMHTEIYQLKAIELYINGFKNLAEGTKSIKDLATDFLLASNFAGIAFSNTGTGAIHAISYPVSGKYHVTHGLANAMFLTAVLEMYQQKDDKEKLTILKQHIANYLSCHENDSFKQLKLLLKQLIIFDDLKEIGMEENEIEIFSKSVILNQQRLLVNSYIDLSLEDIENIYRSVY